MTSAKATKPAEIAIIIAARKVIEKEIETNEHWRKTHEESSIKHEREVDQLKNKLSDLDDAEVPEGWLTPERAQSLRTDLTNTINTLQVQLKESEARNLENMRRASQTDQRLRDEHQTVLNNRTIESNGLMERAHSERDQLRAQVVKLEDIFDDLHTALNTGDLIVDKDPKTMIAAVKSLVKHEVDAADFADMKSELEQTRAKLDEMTRVAAEANYTRTGGVRRKLAEVLAVVLS